MSAIDDANRSTGRIGNMYGTTAANGARAASEPIAGACHRTNESQRRPLEEPLAELERHLISAYLAGARHNLHTLLARNDEEARKLLADASSYAAGKLTEVEARSHYLRKLHGESD